MTKKRTGTREWSDKSLAMQRGCPNNCRYCWAKANALRWKQIKSPEEWKTVHYYTRHDTPYRIKCGMFPSTHDLFDDNVDRAINFLEPWLKIGNKILIVTKPKLSVTKKICETFENTYKNQITWRFTIGSLDQDILDFWEKDAPTFQERMQSLKYAFDNEWRTSVSAEPYLDPNISLLITAVLPYLTDVIWVGKLNRIPERVKTDGWTENDFSFLDIVKNCQTDDFIRGLYTEWKDNPKVKWKDSVKQVLGLPEEEIG